MQVSVKLMNNPSRAEMLAMIDVMVEKLKGFHYGISSIEEDNRDYENFKKSIPTMAFPLLQSNAVEQSLFDAYVKTETKRVAELFPENITV